MVLFNKITLVRVYRNQDIRRENDLFDTDIILSKETYWMCQRARYASWVRRCNMLPDEIKIFILEKIEPISIDNENDSALEKKMFQAKTYRSLPKARTTNELSNCFTDRKALNEFLVCI